MGDATPWPIPFSANRTAGPDGPWNVIEQLVDFPEQTLAMLPSLTDYTVFVPKSACQDQSADCPLPIPGLWTPSAAQKTLASNDSGSFDVSAWNISHPLGLQGNGHIILDRVVPVRDGQKGYIDNQGIAVADNFTVNFPGGAQYTMDVGFLSLNGALNTNNWTTKNNVPVTYNRTLPGAYASGYIPSISYGLHLGAASPNVSGSLYWGGYDSSRCLTEPVTVNGSSVELVDFGLKVQSGGSAYLNLPSGSKEKYWLLQDDLKKTSSVQVQLDPGVPYLYLPDKTCDMLAHYLPVNFDPAFGLYMWDTRSTAYTDIVSSPHYLSFKFSSPGSVNGSSTINVPFALLNLTLSSPLTSTPKQYFPCRPYTPYDGQTYILGRAFLQAAFLAQNWQARTLWLAQAPGPNAPPPSIKTIGKTDETLAPLRNAPSWADTWKGVLKPLPDASSSGKDKELSTGAKVGIGIGVGLVTLIVVLGFALLFLDRVKRRRREAAWDKVEPRDETEPCEDGGQEWGHRTHDGDAQDASDGAGHLHDAPVELPEQNALVEMAAEPRRKAERMEDTPSRGWTG